MSGLLGYAEPWNLRAGRRVALHLSDPEQAEGTLDLVRLVADGVPPRQEWREEPVAGTRVAYRGEMQPLSPGSSLHVADANGIRSFTLVVRLQPTRIGGRVQAIAGNWCEASRDGFAVFLDTEGVAVLRVGDGAVVDECRSSGALRSHEWVELRASYDTSSGVLSLEIDPIPERTPAWLPRRARGEAAAGRARLARVDRPLLFAAWRTDPTGATGAHFDGRLEHPRLSLQPGAEVFDSSWDFSHGIDTVRVLDRGRSRWHGELVNCPARAVTGSSWTGQAQDWTRAPELYGAIHFHSDDLADAEWKVTGELRIPAECPSGTYALRVTTADGRQERFPIFVRPAAGAPTADVLFLIPTATYLAYANHRLGPMVSSMGAGGQPYPFEETLRATPEVGPDTYGVHGDRSGCMYTSRRRPILNLRPDGEGWGYSADLALTGFLEHAGVDYDVATDEDLHDEGSALLRRYRVVVTGSHPEYWSTPMHDALEAWQASGGRLVYLGGNGFYWRVAFSPAFPGVMEVRRAGAATRAWIADPGEEHHAFTGERGGIWRNLGRPPNRVAGVGFTAQGAGARPYVRTPASRDPRAAWIFAGVESEGTFGEHGRGGGAAGEELDRFDVALGSPPHALVLASSGDHGPGMLRVIEEFLITMRHLPHAEVRADLVFYETPSGGAVFSSGSISWISALAHRDYRNDVARITANVIARFADPKPFQVPAGVDEARIGAPPTYLSVSTGD